MISTAQKKNLNKMNRASKDVLLGTLLQQMTQNSVITGSTVVVTAAQASASVVAIATGRTGLIGQVIQINRSGSSVISGSAFSNVKIINSGSAIYVTNGCAVFVENDLLHWLAW